MTLEELLGYGERLQIADIGAAAIAEKPVYKPLLDRDLARLNAFDADERHHDGIRQAFGDRVSLFPDIVGDGEAATLHLASPASGMSSLLAPSAANLGFFNGFTAFGTVLETVPVETHRLDDIAGLPPLDFLKMDIQGSEYAALESGPRVLGGCVAIHLEVSFVPLYQGQATFGDIDVWMRRHGYLPHAFTEIKRWSVNPVVRTGQYRRGYNQLLEADIVYFRDVTTDDGLDDTQLKKLALIAHYCYRSPDIAGRIVLALSARRAIRYDALAHYLAIWHDESGEEVGLYHG
ncbi:MAG: FkbM family methyltransferase [Devosia nanyangense]|uniref:FkbM family methyltransferase n=1 Tax=Devosia nanyangense TaxID=1228055 RepID=A0A933NZ13_9HYPH|nr:FkbM family methyltransferase [Devosia nanyangense]